VENTPFANEVPFPNAVGTL